VGLTHEFAVASTSGVHVGEIQLLRDCPEFGSGSGEPDGHNQKYELDSIHACLYCPSNRLTPIPSHES
jgi:hypothetical protein